MGNSVMTQIGKYFARSIHSPMARPQACGPRQPEPARPKISDDLSLRKKIESIYAGLLKTDFGKRLSWSEKKVAEIERRHGASLIRRLNTESLVLKDGSKLPIGELLLGRLGITDVSEFRLNSETKKAIDEIDLGRIQTEFDDVESQAKEFLLHYETFQKGLADDCQTRDLTRNEAILVRNCFRYASAAGESQESAFELANWNIRQIRAMAAQSKLSDSGRDALVNRLNRNGDIVKERINPDEHSFMTRLQYGLYLSVKKTADGLVADFKRDENWEYFTPDAGFDRRRDILLIKA